jgi:hypothetical protein
MSQNVPDHQAAKRLSAPAFRDALITLCLIGCLLAGCITSPQRPSATQPSTAVDPILAEPSYWLAQPPTATVSSPDFDHLFKVCETVARDFLFKIDRIDYRQGLLTTQPLVSGQWFEPWRRDARTDYDRAESSLATTRRTIRFEFSRQSDDTWQVTPKVLVERQSISEKRITAVVKYRNVFTLPQGIRARPYGSRETDVGVALPERYWYPLRRDATFERALAEAVQKRLDGRG